MGLYKLLHKAHPYQVWKVLEELSSPTLFTQTPLFSRAEIQKTSGQYKATMSIHPDFILSARKGEEYRETIQPRKVYRRTAAFIEKVLASMSLNEMVTKNEINDLVRFFKGKGYRVIRPALAILKQFYQKHQNLPNNLIGYLTKTIRSMTEFTFRNVLERTQLYRRNPFSSSDGAA